MLDPGYTLHPGDGTRDPENGRSHGGGKGVPENGYPSLTGGIPKTEPDADHHWENRGDAVFHAAYERHHGQQMTDTTDGAAQTLEKGCGVLIDEATTHHRQESMML